MDAEERSSCGLGRGADEVIHSQRWIRALLNRAAWSVAGAMVAGALYFGVVLQPDRPDLRRNSVSSDADANKARALMTDADWGLPPNLSDGVVVVYPEIIRELLSRWPGGDGVPIPREVLAVLGINPVDRSAIIF